MIISCLFDDLNVYRSPLSNNVRLLYRITLNGNCAGTLNTDPLHKIGVLHRCIIHFDCM